MTIISESPNYRPGEPLRTWEAQNPVAIVDVNLVIQKAQARDALIRLINGEDLSSDDYIALGRLNSWCVLDWWEPLVLLIDHPRISVEHAAFLRAYAKGFAAELNK